MGEALKKVVVKEKHAVSLRLADPLYQEIARRAMAERRSVASYVELALERYVKDHPRPGLEVVGHDPRK